MDVALSPQGGATEFTSAFFASAIARQAQQDADDVAILLKHYGILPESREPDSTPIGLPPDVLIGLALATRFARWESNEIKVHLNAGLPSSRQVLARVASQWQEPEFSEFVSGLRSNAFRIFYECFIWLVDGETMSAEMAMTAITDEEEFLDAMADYLLAQVTKSK